MCSIDFIKKLLSASGSLRCGVPRVGRRPVTPPRSANGANPSQTQDAGLHAQNRQQADSVPGPAKDLIESRTRRPRNRHVDAATALVPIPGSVVPRVIRVQLITFGDDHVLLASPMPLRADRLLLKRVTPRFDRKFLDCRLDHPPAEEAQPVESQRFHYYGIEVTGFAEWSLLTNRLYGGLLSSGSRPLPRPSTQQPHATPSRTSESSLVPLLSAIGLAVVYASNLNLP